MPDEVSISLTLNGAPARVAAPPSERLLDTLRYRLGLTGTKEGCGEGECGACTVYIDGLPANSCLVPTVQCRGRDVRTIESIPAAVHEPLLKTGATQCGACTPGVAMTAVWIREHPGILKTHTVRELMAGNLCRCTGYDGIIDGISAAMSAVPKGPTQSVAGPVEAVKVSPAPKELTQACILTPKSLNEALTLLCNDPTLIPLAGATDLLVHWPVNLPAHDRAYLDLSALSELRSIRWADSTLTLGALTTYWDVIQDPRCLAEFPLLIDAARQVGAIQIQSRATWAGNIINASPAADGVPVLMAYDAVVVLASSRGESRIPLSEFYHGYKKMARTPDQLVVAIEIPRRKYSFGTFQKVGPRRAQAITKVGLAAVRLADVPSGKLGGSGGWRIVANSVAPVIKRCRAVEAFLDSGAKARSPADFLPAVRKDIAPIDDIRSTAAYRETVFTRLLYHCLK